MPLNLGVVLARRSQVKFLGSVIHEAVKRLHRVTLFVEPWGTPEARFAITDLPWFLRSTVTVHRGPIPKAWAGTLVIHDREVDMLEPWADRPIVGIPYFFTNLIRPPWPRSHATICYHSAYHQARHRALYPDYAGWIQEHPVTGWTGGDHVKVLEAPERIRFRYGLSTPPTIIFTPKRVVSEPLFAKVRRRCGYARLVVGAARTVHEGPILFKTRPKHKDPRWLQLVGRVIGDDSLYPSTAFELLSIARHVHLGMTGAIHEAQWMKVPYTLWPTSFKHATDQPGVAQTIADVTALDVEEMLGPRNQHAAANVVDVIES